MAKCLAIFKGTSVKLKTLVARSAVMFVFSTVKTHLYKRNDYIDPISLHFNANSHQWSDPFVNDFFIHTLLLLLLLMRMGSSLFLLLSIRLTFESVKMQNNGKRERERKQIVRQFTNVKQFTRSMVREAVYVLHRRVDSSKVFIFDF